TRVGAGAPLHGGTRTTRGDPLLHRLAFGQAVRRPGAAGDAARIRPRPDAFVDHAAAVDAESAGAAGKRAFTLALRRGARRARYQSLARRAVERGGRRGANGIVQCEPHGTEEDVVQEPFDVAFDRHRARAGKRAVHSEVECAAGERLEAEREAPGVPVPALVHVVAHELRETLVPGERLEVVGIAARVLREVVRRVVEPVPDVAVVGVVEDVADLVRGGAQ